MSVANEIPARSTRLFVSGLPPNVTNEQLKAHFAAKFPITDAAIVPGRQIGFIGFPDPSVADNALKYFNKSFMRMSKISVDFAREAELSKGKRNNAKHHIEHDKSKRRESLVCANPPARSKRKRDVKDDGEGLRTSIAPTQDSGTALPQPDGGIFPPHDTRRLQSGAEEKDASPVQEALFGAPLSQEDTEAGGPTAETRSDNDWVRGKTSRLLDLVNSEQKTDEGLPTDAVMDNRVDADTKDAEIGENIQESAHPPEKQAVSISVPNARLFIRNLPFTATEQEVETLFSSHGRLEEVHLVRDSKSKSSRGLAYVQFADDAAAASALVKLDAKPFQGRLLHVLPSSDKRSQALNDFEISKLPLKQQKALKIKRGAATATFSWNSLFMSPDAVVSSIANRLGVSKSDVLDPTSSDAAVKQAHAETHVIQETKGYFEKNGIDLESFKSAQKDTKALLVKNFPFGVTEEELRALFEPFGAVSRVLMPPSGTIAMVEMVHPGEAQQALKGLAYKSLKGSVIYVEKAPEGVFDSKKGKIEKQVSVTARAQDVEEQNDDANIQSSTLFVRNLNFTTTSEILAKTFSALAGFITARVKTKINPQRPSEILSMGFGFVDFATKPQAQAAMTAMNGRLLEGHDLTIKISHNAADKAEDTRKEDYAKKASSQKTKIIIKNLPFEVSKKDIRDLFGTYGQLRSVRMPRKFDNSARGFAFADFLTSKEARNALDALRSTHLLGRRLVLEFAEGETVDPEEEIRAIEKKVGQQAHLVELKRLAGPGRRKFNVGDARDEIDG